MPTLIENLNTVLDVFDSSNSTTLLMGLKLNEIEGHIKGETIILSRRLLKEILFKLEKDGYLKIEEEPIKIPTTGIVPVDFYYITIEGELFRNSGGYVKAFEREIRQKKIQNLKDWLLIWGSWIAGLGTLALAGVEIWKLVFPPSCPFH